MGWAEIQPAMREQSRAKHKNRDARQVAIFRAILVNADDQEFRLSTLCERFAQTSDTYLLKMLQRWGFRFDTWGRFTAMPINLKKKILTR